MFENVQAEINSAESSAPEQSPESSTQEQGLNNAPSIFELDKAEKVKYNGQEWSVKDLFSGTLRHADYTRKTQELAKSREEFNSNKKYYDALQSDIDAIEKNPALIAKFKEVYPSQFHWLADRFFKGGNQNGQSQEQSSQFDIDNHPTIRSMSEKLNAFEQSQQQKLVEAYEQKLDTTFKTFEEKYPYANQESIIQRAIALRDAGQKVDDNVLEKIAKDLNGKTYSMIDKKYKEQSQAQLSKGKKGSDIAAGGGIPGPAPAGKKSLRDAMYESIDAFKQ